MRGRIEYDQFRIADCCESRSYCEYFFRVEIIPRFEKWLESSREKRKDFLVTFSTFYRIIRGVSFIRYRLVRGLVLLCRTNIA